MLTAGVAAEHEHEASQMEFVPLGSVVRRLKRHPETFCAPELLPAALLDSYMDVCAWLRAEHTGSSVGIPSICSKPELASTGGAGPALPESLDMHRVVRGLNRTSAAAAIRPSPNGHARVRRLGPAAGAAPSVQHAEPLHSRRRVETGRAAASATTGVSAALVRRALEAAGLFRGSRSGA